MQTFAYLSFFLFFLGALVNGLYLANFLVDFKGKTIKLLFCFLFSAVCFLPLGDSGYSPFGDRLLVYAFWFIISFSLFFIKDILIRINEKTLLVFSMLFYYFLFAQFGSNALIHPFNLPGLLLVGLAVFSRSPFSFSFKAISYIWYLIMVSATSIILFTQVFSLSSFPLIFYSSAGSPIIMNHAEFLLLGATTFYLMAHVVYLLILIPIPSKNESFADRLKNVKEDIHLLVSKFDNTQLTLPSAFLWTLLLLGAMALNQRFQLVSPLAFFNIGLLLLGFSR